MRLHLILAVAIVIAPSAQAQTSGCALLEQIVGAASTGFESLKGEEIDDGWFDSKVYLSDAEECSIEKKATAEFTCVWSADTPAAANTKTVALSAASKICLADWKVDDLAGQKSFNNLNIVKGIGMTGAGASPAVHIYTETFEDSQKSTTWLLVRQK